MIADIYMGLIAYAGLMNKHTDLFAARFRRLFFYLSILLLVLLTGCATRPPVTLDDRAGQEIQLQQLTHWKLTGKLGVRVPGDNGSASLRWDNAAKNYSLDLSGPFGQGRMLITGKPGKVSLQQANEAPLIADSAEELILHVTGWTLPVAQLAYWVRGIPAPHQAITWRETNAMGQLASLEQAGWRIHYSQYAAVAYRKTSLYLPGKITAEYGDIRLTLIARQWQLDH
jgi:outer membrane lipoprotein LolB